MGEYFSYVNHSKQLRFGIGAFGSADKFCGIGSGLTARAFCLLLTRAHDNARFNEFGMGAWIGDRVECIGDHGSLTDEYDEYPCITGNILVLLHQIDGAEEILEFAQKYDPFFMQLAHLVISNQYPALAPDMEQAFGPDWQRRAIEMFDRAGRSWRESRFEIADVKL